MGGEEVPPGTLVGGYLSQDIDKPGADVYLCRLAGGNH